MDVIEFLSILLYSYLIVGLFFGLWYILKGVQKADPEMADTPLGKRLPLLPGAILLWPKVAKKFSKKNRAKWKDRS